MEAIAHVLTCLGLAAGTALGLKGMLDPAWAARLVRLQPQPDKPEGFGEFRATFGGMFAGLHAVALSYAVFGPASAGAACAMVLAAGWWATAAGRALAMAKDPGVAHPFQRQSIGIEVFAGLWIAVWPLARVFG